MNPLPSPLPEIPLATLERFRNQAAAIVAEHRGLTPACLVKLAGVARQLGIAENQTQAAIRSLDSALAGPAAENGKSIRKFRQRLQKDLSGKKKIIGPEIEARILENAAKKYELDEPTARQVLAEVVAELGLRQVTQDQALQHVCASIVAAAGDALWIPQPIRDNLRTAGEQWSIDPAIVEQLIDQRLEENRLAQQTQQKLGLLTKIVAGVAFMGALVALVWFLTNRPGGPNALPEIAHLGEATLPDKSAGTGDGPHRLSISLPAWWDADLAVEISRTRTEYPPFEKLYAPLASQSAETRQQAYQRLAPLAFAADCPPALREVLSHITSRCFILESDDGAAEQLLAKVSAEFAEADAAPPAAPAGYSRLWRAANCLLDMWDDEALPGSRRPLVRSALFTGLDFEPQATEAPAAAEKRLLENLTRRAYRQLIAAASERRGRLRLLHDYILRQADKSLPEEECKSLLVEFIVGVLPGKPEPETTWDEYFPRLFEQTDAISMLKLLEAYEGMETSPSRQRLGALLRKQVGADATRPEAEIPQQVRAALGSISPSLARNGSERAQALAKIAKPLLAIKVDDSTSQIQLLALTTELAQMGTMGTALAQGEFGEAQFDQWYKEYQSQAGSAAQAVASGKAKDAGEVIATEPPRSLTPKEKKDLAEACLRLRGFANSTPIQRASIFRLVANMASLVKDLTKTEASDVSRYLLGEKSEEENEAILPFVANLRPHVELRLALLDRLEYSKLNPHQQQRLAETILNQSVTELEAKQASFRRLLLASVAESLASAAGGLDRTAANAALSLEEAIAKAELTLHEAYSQRALGVGVPRHRLPIATRPSGSLEMALRGLRESSQLAGHEQTLAQKEALERELFAASYLAKHDLGRTIILQRLYFRTWSELLLQQSRRRLSAIEALQRELALADQKASSPARQLYVGELALVKLLLLAGEP